MKSVSNDAKPRSSSANSRNVFAIEDAKCFLQRFDLFLATCNTVLVAFSSIYARRLQLFIVSQRSVQFFLSSIQICLGLLESLLMILLLARLVLDVLGLLSLVDRGIAHELVILLLGLSFSGAGLRLETSEVGLDDFNHANDSAVLGTHALVWLIE